MRQDTSWILSHKFFAPSSNLDNIFLAKHSNLGQVNPADKHDRVSRNLTT